MPRLSRLIRNGCPHSDEFFRGCGMNADGSIELGFRRTALQRYGEALDYLRRVGADHVATQDNIRIFVDDEFHHCPLIAA